MVNRISFFLNSANLIYRGTDISKYFRESLGIRDNESLLYLFPFKVGIFSEVDSAHVHARGRKQCCKLNYFLRRVSITPRPPFVCSLFPKAIFFTFILLQFFFMHLWFYVWRLWCPCLFVVSPSFGASRRLCASWLWHYLETLTYISLSRKASRKTYKSSTFQNFSIKLKIILLILTCLNGLCSKPALQQKWLGYLFKVPELNITKLLRVLLV